MAATALTARLLRPVLASLALALPGAAQEAAPIYDCIVEPAQRLELGSPVAGILDRVLVERGAAVRAGDILAELHSEQETARLRTAEAQAASDALIQSRAASLRLAQTTHDRTQDLLSRRVAAEQQAQEAAAQLETAQMDLRLAELQHELDQLGVEEARADVALRQIRSPIDGIVTERARGPGEYVFQERHVLTVAQIDPLHVEAWLPIELYARMRAAETIHVALSQPDQTTVPARVTIVDQVFDAATGTFGLRAEIDNPGHLIPAGQTCALILDPA